MALDQQGSAGGIAILWNLAEVLAKGWIGIPRILTGKFRLTGTKYQVSASSTYGPHIPGDKYVFLESIRIFKFLNIEKHWVLEGDFNMITCLE